MTIKCVIIKNAMINRAKAKFYIICLCEYKLFFFGIIALNLQLSFLILTKITAIKYANNNTS